ncbi:centromere protein J isoform X2 [Cephus cinctus]|uniref:Centromere protein J isoform X2 n=1 Tax=Cephus cinctus TaxID=211228 RepID=A0AAJ7FI15_CEPCN|nr:centromere protein J isoform X2 [Cephus cinctus]
MALEASIVERLQELRKWQIEQQGRLLKQQEEQRELLSREQDRMYQALGLTIPNESLDENIMKQLIAQSKGECSLDLSQEDTEASTNYKDSLNEDPKQTGNKHCAISESSNKEHLNNDDYNDSDLLSISQVILSKEEPCHTFTTNSINKNRSSEAFDIVTNKNLETQVSIKLSNQSSDDKVEMHLNMPNIHLSTSRNVLGRHPSDESNASVNKLKHECFSNLDLTPQKQRGPISKLTMEGIEPLPSEAVTNKHITIDDIPVPSPKKDFHTLLEERLRDSEALMQNNNDTKKLIKRPFLKKGEGLARFRVNSFSGNTAQLTRRRSASLSANLKLNNDHTSKNVIDKPKDVPKIVLKKNTASKKNIPSVAQQRLSLKNVPLPRNKVRSKSMSRFPTIINDKNNVKPPIDLKNSDVEAKTKRDLEEGRIFELLEEKAEHSSFCSTSSTVVALLQQSVQTTPLKSMQTLNNGLTSIQTHKANVNIRKDIQEEDLLLQEIVCSTESNKVKSNTNIHKKSDFTKDIVLPKWESIPFINEQVNQYHASMYNSSQLNAARNQQFGYTTAAQVSQKFSSQSVQYIEKNLLNNSINEDEKLCELPYGMDIDAAYDADYSKGFDDCEASNQGYDGNIGNEERNVHKNYSDERAWSDCSAPSDSSDAEASLIKTQKSPVENTEELVMSKPNKDYDHDDFSDRSSMKSLPDIDDNDSGNQKIIGNHEGPSADPMSDEEYCQYEDCKELSDDEEPDVHTHMNYDLKDRKCETKKDISSKINSIMNNNQNQLIDVRTEDTNGTIFKSELLKSRLLELEQEIDIFRKENAALTIQRQKLQDEQKKLQQQYKEKEAVFEENRVRVENSLQEEKKRLTREKMALENRLKDAQQKAQKNKQERQEVHMLREQLEELREDIIQKESRWNAAQARHKSQVRILHAENAKLKQELEKLQNAKKNNIKFRKLNPPTNTRAIHQINKQLDDRKKPQTKQDSSEDEDQLIRPMMESIFGKGDSHEAENSANHESGKNIDGSKLIIYEAAQKPVKSYESIAKKRIMYEHLLKDATIGIAEHQDAIKKATEEFERLKNESQNSRIEDTDDAMDNIISNHVPLELEQSHMNDAVDSDVKRNSMKDADMQKGEVSCSRTSIRNRKSNETSPNKDKMTKQGIKEVRHPDGRLEYWYPNGNVKKLSADRNIIKMIYYNGDVRESNRDGGVKYFYASTRTWHTTMPDGLEILEFPDGQVERRSKNGTVEVSFPDGSVRILQSDGSERWALPDGTIAETFTNGEKILTLPNGQREVHTKDHKRREYPDGTVKLVYPDGSQETRYASGRVRLKDKDGNLIMDSQQQ